MKVGTPSLDQLMIFITLVESGGFAPAGRAMGRATSAIAYGIDNLEAQLGLTLLHREGTKRPVLTDAGRALLVHARTVLMDVDAMRATASGLLEGREAEVSITVDVMLPTARLVDALQGFRAAFPAVSLRLHVEALGAVVQCMAEGRARMGISSPMHPIGEGIECQQMGSVGLIPVASPLHPLAALPRVTRRDVRQHVQLVLTDRSSVTEGQDFGIYSQRTWRLADIGVKHALLVAGLGWGSMPAFMVEEDLEKGRLLALDMPEWRGLSYPLQAIWRSDQPPGPATRWLIDRFAAQR